MDYPNYQKVMEQTKNATRAYSQLAKELDEVDEFISDLPLVPASSVDMDEGGFLEPWKYNKNSDLADMQSPYSPHSFETYERTDYMFMRKTAVYQRWADYLKDPSSMDEARMENTKVNIQAIFMDMSNDFVHGNPEADPRQALGLEGRFNVITDQRGVIQNESNKYYGKINPYITLDAGGTDPADLTSVYLLIPSPVGVRRIYPSKGMYTGGIFYKPGEWHDVQEKDKVSGKDGYTQARVDYIHIASGLSFKNRRAGVRIANIDVKKLDNFNRTLRFAVQAIKRSGVNGTIRMYANSDLIPELQEYYDSKKYPATYEAAKPSDIGNNTVVIGGLPVRTCDHILSTEEHIA